MLKDVKVMFIIGKAHLDTVDQLAKKLKLSRSKLIRLGLDEVISKYRPGHEGEITILETKFLNTVLTNLGNRIYELENPGIDEEERLGKEIYKLNRAGKGAEAQKLINESIKKGLNPLYVLPEEKKLSPEEHEKMLDERYPGRKKQ